MHLINEASSATIGGPRTLVEVMLRRGRMYDEYIARFLARLSTWCYCDEATLRRVLESLALEKIDGLAEERQSPFTVDAYFEVRNDALFVASSAFILRDRSGKVAVLCYRGTEPVNLINWMTNASMHRLPFEAHREEFGAVHGGFLRNTLVTWPQIVASLQRDDRLEALYITGHSLGGAMALLAGALIHAQDPQLLGVLRGVYTFGQPMVGDAAFAKCFASTLGAMLYLHVYDHDIVPRLPPRSAGAFRHFGEERRAARHGRWVHRPERAPVGQVTSALMSIPVGAVAWVLQQLPYLDELSLPWSWDDHQPSHYLQCFGGKSDILRAAGLRMFAAKA